jgi:hypothetical protein
MELFDGTLGGRGFGAFEIELSVRVDLSFARILREHAAREAVQNQTKDG